MNTDHPTLKVSAGRKLVQLLSVMLFGLVTMNASAQGIEKQALAHLEHIRAIRADADEETVAGYNKRMDEAWKFFNANTASVLPILRRELSLELQKERPNNMLLLDIGYYLRLQPASSDSELGKTALFKLDPSSDVVYMNQQQLFNFTFLVAFDQDPRVLPFLDKAFLRQKMTAYVPQHALTLTETLACVFLYGVHGTASEAHLKTLLKDKAVAKKILEILIWIGTPDSIPEVKAAMLADRTFETFTRGTTFMMKAGGPLGRAFLLSLNPKDFDAQSQEYYERIRPRIEATSYETLRREFSAGGDFAPLSDDEIKIRLAEMFENNGKDDRTDPRALLDSRLPRTFLVNELVRIRARMFRRLSDESLHDVVATNAVLNALYYRER